MTEYPVLCSSTNRLDRFDKTLYPATALDAELAKPRLPMWLSDDDGRFVISPVAVENGTATPVAITLTDDWQTVVVKQGLILAVRSAPCGGGCHCSGEFAVDYAIVA